MSDPPRTVSNAGSRVQASSVDDGRLLATIVGIATEAASNQDSCFPAPALNALRDAGVLATSLSSAWGGRGWGSEPGRMRQLLSTLTRLGWGDLAVARLYEGHANALLLMQTFGTVEQIGQAAADVHDHGRFFAVWNTGPADDVQLAPIGQDRYRLTGAKTFASGVGYVDRALVTGALPDGGWQIVILPMETLDVAIDYTWWQPHGMEATASHKVDFTGVEVERDQLLGAPGNYYDQPWFSGGAIRFAAAQMGAAAALLDAARDELRALGRTDDPYQRQRIGRTAIAVESGNRWLIGAAELADQSRLGGPGHGPIGDEAMVIYAHMMRTAIERICLDVLELVERSVGVRGLFRSHRIERMSRDLRFYLRQPAPDAALAEVGRFMLASSEPALDLWPLPEASSADPAGE